jgi:opacity protein-like surface antigen
MLTPLSTRAVVAAATLIAAPALGAQLVPPASTGDAPSRTEMGNRPSRFAGGLTLIVTQPVGAFRDYVGESVGIGGHALVGLVPNRALSLRLDGDVVQYGRQSRRIYTGGWSGLPLDEVTTNNVGTLMIGPQLAVPSGPVRPYVHGGIGFAYFNTGTSVECSRCSDDYDDPLWNRTHLSDLTLSYGGGGGIAIALGRGIDPITLDLGARYQHNGNARYLRKGSIVDGSTGPIFTPIESQANYVVYRLGVSVPVR